MPGSWHPAAFEKLTTTCSWERFKATEVKSQWKWPNFSIFVQKSLEPVDIIFTTGEKGTELKIQMKDIDNALSPLF